MSDSNSNQEFHINPKELFELSMQHNREVLTRLNCDVYYVASLDIDDQVKYADPVTRKYINNKKFYNMDSSIESESDYANVNATGLGNLAYIILHCKDKDARDRNMIILEKCIEYYKNTNRPIASIVTSWCF